MSTNARDDKIIHMPPDCDPSAMIKRIAAEAEATDEEIVDIWRFTWNDAPERTQAEVVAALRGAAESVEKERAE